jgi:hypothetical protein
MSDDADYAEWVKRNPPRSKRDNDLCDLTACLGRVAKRIGKQLKGLRKGLDADDRFHNRGLCPPQSGDA